MLDIGKVYKFKLLDGTQYIGEVIADNEDHIVVKKHTSAINSEVSYIMKNAITIVTVC